MCSNTKNKHIILKSYKERWAIESMFKNMKTQGFNIEDTHMKNSDRLGKLMAIVAIAMLFTSLFGTVQKCAFKKTVKTPLYSVFTKGLKAIRHIRRTDYEQFLSLFKRILENCRISEG